MIFRITSLGSVFSWRLERPKTKEVIAVSGSDFPTESAARADVAAAKKAMGGVRFAKVVVDESNV